MHHLHISTGFMLAVALFVLGLVALLVWARKKPAVQIVEKVIEPTTDIGRTYGAYAHSPWLNPANGSRDWAAPGPSTVVVQDNTSGLMAGVMLGEMLAGPRTVIEPVPMHEPVYAEPVYAEPAATSGFDYSSNASDDSASSGGFDISWD